VIARRRADDHPFGTRIVDDVLEIGAAIEHVGRNGDRAETIPMRFSQYNEMRSPCRTPSSLKRRATRRAPR
jgi:hypothetical protein